jgi:hypothetical protein
VENEARDESGEKRDINSGALNADGPTGPAGPIPVAGAAVPVGA